MEEKIKTIMHLRIGAEINYQFAMPSLKSPRKRHALRSAARNNWKKAALFLFGKAFFSLRAPSVCVWTSLVPVAATAAAAFPMKWTEQDISR
jgi:hypothetical protein